MGRTVRGSIPCRSERFFYPAKRADWLWILDFFPFNGYWLFFPEVKRLGREFNHSSPPSTEVENEWSCTSAPSTCLNGMARGDSFKLI